MLDKWLNEKEEPGIRHTLVDKIADHYKVRVDRLQAQLLSRQCLLIDHFTDYTKPASEADLQILLRQMNEHIGDVIGRLAEKMDELDQALATAKIIQAEATRVLAEFKARCLHNNLD